MKLWSRIAVLAAACALIASAAQARPKIVEKTEYYEVGGDTGWQLFREMNRHGPRHGFLTKAIAQTRYTSTPRGEMVHENGVCRVAGGGFTLTITYIYPKPREKLSADLQRRWRAFMADNVRHEKTHGQIARKMAVALDDTMRSFAVRDGANCRRAILRLKSDLKAVYDRFEKAQRAFDVQEHRERGPVDQSVAALIGKR